MYAMNLREDVQRRAWSSGVLLTMKLITASLLLVALGVIALSAHHDEASGLADPGSSVTVVAAGDVSTEQSVAAASVTDSAVDALMTVCALIVVCCVFLVAARFTWSRGGRTLVLAVSPRGSPRSAPPALRLPDHLSLTQLSISRT